MTFFHNYGWRLCLLLSGAAMLVGGPMHPSSDAEDPLGEELATMTADGAWVPGHSLILLSVVLLATGLWVAYRTDAWPEVRRPLLVAATAFSLYAVEALMHLLAFIDADALAEGEFAPVALSHVGLGTVLYPVSGWALVYLAWSMGRAGGVRRPVSWIGVLAGVLHACSVPLSLILPDTELSVMFASAALLIAGWSLLVALTGAPTRQRTPRAPVEAIV